MRLTDRQLDRLQIYDDAVYYDHTDPDMVGLPQTTMCHECGQTIHPRAWLDTCNELRAQLAAAQKTLSLKRNNEGIWLHIKTDTAQAAVLVAGSGSGRGPIVMAALDAALAEQEEKP